MPPGKRPALYVSCRKALRRDYNIWSRGDYCCYGAFCATGDTRHPWMQLQLLHSFCRSPSALAGRPNKGRWLLPARANHPAGGIWSTLCTGIGTDESLFLAHLGIGISGWNKIRILGASPLMLYCLFQRPVHFHQSCQHGCEAYDSTSTSRFDACLQDFFCWSVADKVCSPAIK